MNRLRPRSKRRERERVARKALERRVLDRDEGICQAQGFLKEPCKFGLDVHEIIPRSHWTHGYLVDDNCIAICRRHHDLVHTNPEKAFEKGLLVLSKWVDPTPAA